MAGFDPTVVYRDIQGFPGYRVGDDGSVWTNQFHSRNPLSEWRQRKLIPRARGYLRVALWAKGKGRQVFVHVLVLEVFVGPCPSGMECCHNDGDPSNNRLENLRWDTRQANSDDTALHGSRCRGSLVGTSKLTEGQVSEILVMCAAGTLNFEEVGARFNVSGSTVGKIARRRIWRHLSAG